LCTGAADLGCHVEAVRFALPPDHGHDIAEIIHSSLFCMGRSTILTPPVSPPPPRLLDPRGGHSGPWSRPRHGPKGVRRPAGPLLRRGGPLGRSVADRGGRGRRSRPSSLAGAGPGGSPRHWPLGRGGGCDGGRSDRRAALVRHLASLSRARATGLHRGPRGPAVPCSPHTQPSKRAQFSRNCPQPQGRGSATRDPVDDLVVALLGVRESDLGVGHCSITSDIIEQWRLRSPAHLADTASVEPRPGS